MKWARAILSFFSDLTEATTATSADWLAIQKSGESEIKKIKPTNLPYLSSSGGSIAGNLTLTGATGQRSVNIGQGRTADGITALFFYSVGNSNQISTSIQRGSGENAEFRIIQIVGAGAARFQCSVMRIRNMADDAFAEIQASKFTVNSDPRNKREIAPLAAIPSPQALGAAAIEFEWDKSGNGQRSRRRHLGFDAAQIRDIAPLASVEMHPLEEDPEYSELGIDLAALIAIQARQIAELDARVSALESRKKPG